ncbi:MAG TPA: sigma factor-like helix-turn-helix DNA-binding protein [Rhizomicrobium sp.]|jgi:DNA-directed RNA polymerase specialized sigma24 family protein
MDTRTNPSIPNPSREKRTARYSRFELTPEDQDLIAQLPAEQQAALRSEGSYASRAEQMGVAIGTVRSRLHRARAALVRLREARERKPSQDDDSGALH